MILKDICYGQYKNLVGHLSPKLQYKKHKQLTSVELLSNDQRAGCFGSRDRGVGKCVCMCVGGIVGGGGQAAMGGMDAKAR